MIFFASRIFEKPLTLNQRVQGSSPCAPTTEKLSICFYFLFGDARRTLPIGAADFCAVSVRRSLALFSRPKRSRLAPLV
jgi:hypothetical protein